jgi:hypothetical protein
LLIIMWLFLNTGLTATARGNWDYWIEIILITLALAGIWWQIGEDRKERQQTRDRAGSCSPSPTLGGVPESRMS